MSQVTVLLVDDSLPLRLCVSEILIGSGYVVRQADCGESALRELADTRRVDVMIVDMNMPGMHGLDLIATVRALPAHRFTPIICLTTETSQETREAARKAGATGWIEKPPQAQRLLAAIKLVTKPQ
jgi:two-component system, chemotaxis family, chemotaxis protein CheY